MLGAIIGRPTRLNGMRLALLLLESSDGAGGACTTLKSPVPAGLLVRDCARLTAGCGRCGLRTRLPNLITGRLQSLLYGAWKFDDASGVNVYRGDPDDVAGRVRGG